MKTIKTGKRLVLVATATLLLQACTIYHSQSLSMEEAFQEHTKVKIYSEKGRKYKFNRLEKENDLYIGFAKHKSKTAKTLATINPPDKIDGKFQGFFIDADTITSAQTKNKSLSTLATVGTAILGTALVVEIIAVITFLNDGFTFNWE